MGKATENMVSEGREIGSAVGGKTEGQPYHAHALPKKDKLRLAYSEVVYGCNYDGLEGPEWNVPGGAETPRDLGKSRAPPPIPRIYMGFEMAGSDRHVFHVRRPFTIRTKWHTSVLAEEDSGFLFCPKPETTSVQ